MEEELARLSSCTVVACLCRDQDNIEPGVIKRGFYNCFGLLQTNVKVVRHCPEDFRIDFKYPHHRDAAVALERLPIGNLNICI